MPQWLDKLRKWAIGPPQTRKYVPQQQMVSWGLAPRDLPIFTFQTVRAMLWDPTIRLGLAMREAPLCQAEFAYQDGESWKNGVWAEREDVAAFVRRQLWRIWTNDVPALARAAQTCGWTGAEVMYRVTSHRTIEYDSLLTRHPADVRALELNGELWGVAFASGGDERTGSKVRLQMPRAFWHAFMPEDGALYGQSILRGAYSPWADKWFDGCALDVRRLFAHKDAYGGVDLTYPSGTTEITKADGTLQIVPNNDIARQIAEQIKAGGVTTRPSELNADGKELWTINRATVPANPAHIFEYPKQLDVEMLRGIEIPDDVITSEATGSWAGKTVPQQAFYTGLDRWGRALIGDICRQIIDPLLVLNYGKKQEYHVTLKPLALQMLEQQQAQGGQQNPNQQGGDDNGGLGDLFGGDDGGGQPPNNPQGGQAMSLRRRNVAEALVGSGILDAGKIVEATRLALEGRRRFDLSPGAVKVEDGTTYTLNTNHRWERQDSDAPEDSPGSAPGKQTAEHRSWAKKIADAVKSTEHHAVHLISHAVHKLPPPLNHWVVGGFKLSMVTFSAGRKAAEAAGRARGLDDEQTTRLGQWLGIVDLIGLKAAPIAIAAAGLGTTAAIGSTFAPIASLCYLGYCTARNPVATVNAARRVVSETIGKLRHPTTLAVDPSNTALNAAAILAHAADQSWAMAVLSAALDTTGDADDAIAIARQAIDAHQVNPADAQQTDDAELSEGGGDSPTMMAIAIGSTKVVNGTTYRFNKNKRWERAGTRTPATVKRRVAVDEKAAGALKKALDTGTATREDFGHIAEHLHTFRVDDLRALRQRLRASFGGASKKSDMVEALRAHVKKIIASPGGSKPSVHAAVRVEGPAAWQAAAKKTLDVVSSVHGWPKKSLIPVSAVTKGSLGKTTNGAFGARRDANGKRTPAFIKIDTTKKAPASTLVHEMGHYLDLQLGNGNYLSLSNDPHMRGVLDAIRKTQSYQLIKEFRNGADQRSITLGDKTVNVQIDKKFAKYATLPQELFARAYAQHIARKTRDPAVSLGIDKTLADFGKDDYFPMQWEEEDFAPVGKAIDALLKAKGLSK